MISVILHEPDMPQNTGNIVRLCANAGAALHLIEPLGFAWDDKRLRRAHLDYEEFAEVQRHAGWEACKVALTGSRIFAIETGGTATPYETEFQPGDALLFGSESRGLPEEILAEVTVLTLPMMPGSRSLNLSNAVAITVYEAWRQLAFATATPLGTPPRERSFAFFNGNPGQTPGDRESGA
ncbi:tRNA (cytidine(34)-2'-O)-methyltransferase [Armatimonas sp.]|uniref:tRNA (cytidine(34)-2'-O)-methyltransferase n=1 Tax=Armatimonas sp. TaxID=1872638 RepID=UPI00286D07D1|nr:tRNA (cytidine(34)-2'-O)-methyltransferase [Armatimonas sp.]